MQHWKSISKDNSAADWLCVACENMTFSALWKKFLLQPKILSICAILKSMCGSINVKNLHRVVDTCIYLLLIFSRFILKWFLSNTDKWWLGKQSNGRNVFEQHSDKCFFISQWTSRVNSLRLIVSKHKYKHKSNILYLTSLIKCTKHNRANVELVPWCEFTFSNRVEF